MERPNDTNDTQRHIGDCNGKPSVVVFPLPLQLRKSPLHSLLKGTSTQFGEFGRNTTAGLRENPFNLVGFEQKTHEVGQGETNRKPPITHPTPVARSSDHSGGLAGRLVDLPSLLGGGVKEAALLEQDSGLSGRNQYYRGQEVMEKKHVQ